MPFKTFTAGVLTSSDVNTFLMQQAVITCTSSTRPSSPVEGMTIYETDTDFYRTWSGSAWEMMRRSGAWTTFTPTLSSFGSGTDWALGNGSTTGAYIRVGRAIIGFLQVTFGSTSTFGTKNLHFPTPITGRTLPNDENAIGQCLARDVSGADGFQGIVRHNNVATFMVPQFIAASGTYGTTVSVTSTIPMTWANGDFLTMSFAYELAS